MSLGNLADLDELILLCRAKKARAYITEAVACYRAGAYRAAIVSTWISVCYDIIDKFHELALSGDKEAEKQIQDIEKSRASNNIAGALEIERNLLSVAKDKFELLSPIEYADLCRLQEDRNRCAHPTLASEDQKFEPPAELARLHIRSTVTHLLQHEPAQGKYALERLIRDVNSTYFPTSPAEAIASLSSGPLKRARESLVRNFVIVLFKQVLKKQEDVHQKFRSMAALAAVQKMRGGIFEEALKEKLPSIVDGLQDDDISNAADFVVKFPNCWSFLLVSSQRRLASFVSCLDEASIIALDSFLDCSPLKKAASARLSRTTWDEVTFAIVFGEHPLINERIIKLYVSSESFDESNKRGKDIKGYVKHFSSDQQRLLLTEMSKNNQITGSFEVAAVLSSVYKSGVIPQNELDDLFGELKFQVPSK